MQSRYSGIAAASAEARMQLDQASRERHAHATRLIAERAAHGHCFLTSVAGPALNDAAEAIRADGTAAIAFGRCEHGRETYTLEIGQECVVAHFRRLAKVNVTYEHPNYRIETQSGHDRPRFWSGTDANFERDILDAVSDALSRWFRIGHYVDDARTQIARR